MQSLMDEVAALHGRAGGKGCGVEGFLSEQEFWPLPDGKERRFTRAEWEEVLGTSKLQHKAIHAVLVQHGFENGPTVVTRHRNGDCACRKT